MEEGQEPYEIQIEFPIENKDNQIFIPRDKKSKRKQKPLMDLVIDKEDFRFCAEFGLFKTNL